MNKHSSDMIQRHLYTNKLDTPLFAEYGGNGNPICKVGKGNWVGVIDKKDDWYLVITNQCQGWIKMQDVEERSPLTLHVHWEPGKPIQYIAA